MRTLIVIIGSVAVLAGAGVLLLSRNPGEPVRADARMPNFDAAFWKTWGDGQAELAAYDLTYPRYGKPRRGVAVTVFVSETFSDSARVKADPGKHPRSDEFSVMKLNLIEDFQTGIYDYNEETSSFLALEKTPGTLTKVSFGSQEWCGHVYAQLKFDQGKLRLTSHSYFDGEADDQRELVAPAGGISEEQLFFWARGMANPILDAGQAVTVPLLPSLQETRHSHKSLAWTSARLSRGSALRDVTVPAGHFQVETWKAEIKDGPTRTFYVEPGGARRLVQWESSTGESARLLGTDRMKYWQMNQPGGEEALKRLGLSLRPPRTP
jgi:hypothetical protein